MLVTVRSHDLPPLGQRLAGGLFFARYSLNDEQRALVLLDSSCELEGYWGKYGQNVSGANSYIDGLANTRAMAGAGSKIAKQVIEAGAHIPSCLEGQYLMVAKRAGLVKDLRENSVYWLSSQYCSRRAYYMDFEEDWQSDVGKLNFRLVRPVLSVLVL